MTMSYLTFRRPRKYVCIPGQTKQFSQFIGELLFVIFGHMIKSLTLYIAIPLTFSLQVQHQLNIQYSFNRGYDLYGSQTFMEVWNAFYKTSIQ